MERAVGRIVEVRGVKVRAELYRLFPPYIVTKGCGPMSRFSAS